MKDDKDKYQGDLVLEDDDDIIELTDLLESDDSDSDSDSENIITPPYEARHDQTLGLGKTLEEPEEDYAPAFGAESDEGAGAENIYEQTIGVGMLFGDDDIPSPKAERKAPPVTAPDDDDFVDLDAETIIAPRQESQQDIYEQTIGVGSLFDDDEYEDNDDDALIDLDAETIISPRKEGMEDDAPIDLDAETIIAPRQESREDIYEQTVGVGRLFEDDDIPSLKSDGDEPAAASIDEDEDEDSDYIELDAETILTPDQDLYEQTIGVSKLFEDDEEADEGIVDLEAETIIAPPELYEQTVAVSRLPDDESLNLGKAPSEGDDAASQDLDAESILMPDSEDDLFPEDEEMAEILDLEAKLVIASEDVEETVDISPKSDDDEFGDEAAMATTMPDDEDIFDLSTKHLLEDNGKERNGHSDGKPDNTMTPDEDALMEPDEDAAAEEDIAIDLTEDILDLEESPEIDLDAPDEITDEMTDDLADEMEDDLADEMADDLADEITDDLADEMADDLADEITDDLADEMADDLADELVNGLADDLADEEDFLLGADEYDDPDQPLEFEAASEPEPEGPAEIAEIDDQFLMVDEEKDAPEAAFEHHEDTTGLASVIEFSEGPEETIDTSPLRADEDAGEDDEDAGEDFETAEAPDENPIDMDSLYSDEADAADISAPEAMDLETLINRTRIDESDIHDMEALASEAEADGDADALDEFGQLDLLRREDADEDVDDLTPVAPSSLMDDPLMNDSLMNDSLMNDSLMNDSLMNGADAVDTGASEADATAEADDLEQYDGASAAFLETALFPDDLPDEMEQIDEKKERDLLSLIEMDLGGEAVDMEEPVADAETYMEDALKGSQAQEPKPEIAESPEGKIEAPSDGETPAMADISQDRLEAALERVVRKVFAEKIENILYEAIEKAVAKELSKIRDLLIPDADGGQ